MVAYAGVSRHDVRRTILNLAWPVIIANFLQTLATTVDILLVGHLPEGKIAVDAVGLGAQVFFVAFSAAFAVSTGTIALVARFTGAGDLRSANHTLKVSLALGLLLALPVALLGILGAPLLVSIFGVQDAQVLSEGVVYTSTLFYSIPFLFVNILATAALRGRGDTRTPLYIGGLVNLVNFGINYNLIYGRLGLPALGVLGAAIGTVTSYAVGAAVFVAILTLGRAGLSLRGSPGANPLDPGLTRRIFRLGAPAAAEQILLQVGFTVWVIFVAGFGDTTLAAHLVGFRITSMAFMPGFGYSVAATALVGQNLGARDSSAAERSAKESMKLAVATMVLIAAVFFVLAEPLAYLFIPDPAVVALAALWIRIYSFGMPAFGIFFTTDGALRGAGDILWPAATSTTGLLAIRLPLSYLLGLVIFHSILGVWIPLIIEYYIRTGVIYWRFSSGAWKAARV